MLPNEGSVCPPDLGGAAWLNAHESSVKTKRGLGSKPFLNPRNLHPINLRLQSSFAAPSTDPPGRQGRDLADAGGSSDKSPTTFSIELK